MKKSVGKWQIIIGILVILSSLVDIVEISPLGWKIDTVTFSFLLLGVFAIITGISNLKK